MRVPNYIKRKIEERCEAQLKANVLQQEIEDWFKKNGIDIGEYYCTHICLYTEPGMVKLNHLKILEREENKDGTTEDTIRTT